MLPINIESLPLPAQLQELETTYAEYMVEGDASVLMILWKEMQRLRTKLGLPIYDYVTPKAERI